MFLLQLSDCHLFADAAGRVHDVDTDRSLAMLVERIRQRHPAPAAVLATGDLSHDGTAASYRRLAQRLAPLACPVLALPGNHDRPALLRETLAGPAFRTGPVQRLARWRILLLDSTVPGCEQGRLAPATLTAVAAELDRDPAPPTLLCLHHQPVPVGSPWIDAIGLENGHALLALVARHPCIRALLFGHVHQPFDRPHGGCRLLGSPATCVQFQPRSPRPAIDPERPAGYRWLHLAPDGRLETGIGWA